MKTLSIHNPEAYFVAYGIKNVENRVWTTRHRGSILIHVSTFEHDILDRLEVFRDFFAHVKWIDDKWDVDNSEFLGLLADNVFCLKNEYKGTKYAKQYELLKFCVNSGNEGNPHPLITGAIIGKVDIVDIQKNYDSEWADSNCYNWILANPIVFNTPVLQVKGKLRLWEFDIEKHMEV